MSENRWMFCFLLAVVLGVLLRIGVSAVSRAQTPHQTLLLALAGLGVFAAAQGLLLYVTLSITQLSAAFVPALAAVGLADLAALAVILLCFFTRRKRRLTDTQKIELSEL